MSKWDAQELIDAASRYESLPSRERLGNVRSAVLRRSLALGAGAAAGTGFLAKAVALGSTTLGQVAVFASVGAIAGGAVVGAASGAKWIVSQRATVATSAVPHAGAAPRALAPAAVTAAPRLTAAPALLPAAPSDDNDVAPVGEGARRQEATPDGLQRPTANSSARPFVSRTATDLERAAIEPKGAPVRPDLQAMAQPEATLPLQLDLLREMRSDLSEGRGLHALSIYRERAAIFRGSPLEPEARAAYIGALCQSGRAQEAARETALFRASFPSSHLGDRLASGCAAEPLR